LAEGDLT